jgi:2-phosphosulfolactate phosphatase
MNIDIDGETAGRVCIVVDVLRASSTMVTLLERGCERIVVSADVAQARTLHERLPDHLLCGEEGGFPPEGFDHGNSPVEFSRLDLAGKSVILATTNGTLALTRVAGGAAAVLVGCLLNRTAVAEAAARLASDLGADITVVCAGQSGSPAEDGAAARAIIEAAEGRATPGFDAAREVAESAHAGDLRRIGLGADVEYCTRLDTSQVVPVLQPGEDGLLVLRAMQL